MNAIVHWCYILKNAGRYKCTLTLHISRPVLQFWGIPLLVRVTLWPLWLRVSDWCVIRIDMMHNLRVVTRNGCVCKKKNKKWNRNDGILVFSSAAPPQHWKWRHPMATLLVSSWFASTLQSLSTCNFFPSEHVWKRSFGGFVWTHSPWRAFTIGIWNFWSCTPS